MLPMRTTLAIDDDLLAKARAYTGFQEKSALVREALKALVEREAARRVARLGGTMSNVKRLRAADLNEISRRHDSRRAIVDGAITDACC